MTQTNQLLSRMSLFAAISVVMGYAFISIPNVEMISATIFISGYFLGWKPGVIVGMVAEGIFSLFNPFGAPTPPLLIAQLLSFGILGLTGGLWARAFQFNRRIDYPITGFVGAAFTIMYAIATTLSFILFAGTGAAGFWSSIFTGIGYYVTHILSNFLIFTLLVPFIIKKTGSFAKLKS